MIAPDDMPPRLEWESPVWWLYERVQTQWRVGMAGATGLDYNPAIAIIQALQWDLPLALELLQEIERELLSGKRKA